MSISLWTKSDKGLKLVDVADLLKSTQDAWAQIFPGINLDPATPQGQLITVITETLLECQSQIVELANILFSGGSGPQLDIRNKMMFGITRKKATPNYIDVKIKGLPNFIIPKGTILTDENDTIKFYLPNDIIINESGEMTISFYNDEDLSNKSIAIGQLNTLKGDFKSSIQEVKNTSYLFKAQPQESDAEFLERAKKSTQYNSDSLLASGVSYLLNINGVKKVSARENMGEQDAEYKGATLPGHSITYVVEGGDISEISAGILKKKNPGCDLGGDIHYIATDSTTRQKYDISFFRPEYTPLYVNVVIQPSLNDEKNYQEVIYNKLSEYLSNFEIGEDINTVDVINSVFDFNFKIKSFIISDEDNNTYKQTISAKFKTLFTLSQNNVKINLG